MHNDSWMKAAWVVALLAMVTVFSGIGYLAWKGEQNFKKECVAVSGEWSYDSDSDLECYRNGIEIAEHGESSPR